jgi:hypothetical protein
LNSLEELNILLGNAIEESEGLLPGGATRGKSLRPVTRLDTEIE